MESSSEKILPHVKIVYEVPVLGRDPRTGITGGGYQAWEYSLSQEEVNEHKDLRIRFDGEWISVEKYDCQYLRGNTETGKPLTPIGEWKTIFIIPKSRVIYMTTEDVAFFANKGTVDAD